MERKTLFRRRRGSALVMVLGILSILMLLAITFGTFVRTERSGSTNLKNGAVARNSLYTAVGRVMEAIDLSFDSPDGDWPVPIWPNPWLASSSFTDDDHILSTKRGSLDPHLDVPGLTSNERNSLAKIEDQKTARVLTAEIAQYLSPSQLSLVRNAKCKWAPLKGAVTATKRGTSRGGGALGNVGRPEGDDLIGRYAFVVLDTTGLPDMNVIGLNDSGPAGRDPADPTTFVLPYSSVSGAVEDRIHKAENKPPFAFKSFVKNLDDFADNRIFASLADARAACASATFDTGPFSKDDLLPADLFAGFSPSLQELNPAGRPKIFFPAQADFAKYSDKAVKAFFGRVFAAMVAVFARSREADPDADVTATSYEKDQLKIFPGTGCEYQLNRSALAAVAIMDGADGDNTPGKFDNDSASVDYWRSNDCTGQDVSAPDKDQIPGGPKERVLAGDSAKLENVRKDRSGDSPHYLNFPCTESAFLVDSVCAWVEWSEPDLDDPDEGAEAEYEGTLHVKARVVCANTTDEKSEHTPRVRMQWFVMPGEPAVNFSSKAGDEKIWEDQLEWDENGDKMIDWDELFVDGPTRKDPADTGWEKDSLSDDKNRKDAKIVTIEDEYEFTVKAQAVPKVDDDGEPVDWLFLPPTRAEYDLDDKYEEYGPDGDHPSGLSHPEDVFIPVAVKIFVQDEKKSTGNGFVPVQEVPAPALETDSEKGWWIRVNPCVYHGPGSDFSGAGDPWGDPAAGDGNAGGWAICLAPPFAYDTTSLGDVDRNTLQSFWVNDQWSRSSSGGGNVWGGGGTEAPDEVLEELFWNGSGKNKGNANFSENFVDGNAGWDGSGATTLRESWLASFSAYSKYAAAADKKTGPFGKWLDRSSHKYMPDFLHKAGKNREVFHKDQDEDFSMSELYTRIPANGWKSAADLGSAMCGPYETLSLFKTWRAAGGVDFHPVLDYFASESDRYPSTNDVNRYVSNGRGDFRPQIGDMDWSGLSAEGADLFSAAHNGRVNLNLPRLVKVSTTSGRGERCSPVRYNPFPAAMVFNGASPYSNSDGQVRSIGEEEAFALAFDVCRMLENAGTGDENLRDVTWGESFRFSSDSSSVRRPFVRNVSFLGQGSATDNQLLHDFLVYQLEGSGTKNRYPQNDADREGLLRATVDGFCTRGQTFLAIIRADAYSPKFGENESAEDGSTLATTHALVELFRDPVPVRAADGSLPVDGDGNPIVYHNWYIRSFRVF